jgi:hypothetical protein
MLVLMVISTQGIKNVLIQISAFTIGHGISLFLLIFPQLHLVSRYVELAITCSVLIYSFIILINYNSKPIAPMRYISLLIFGMLHGLGFIKQTEIFFTQETIWPIVMGFNFGIECAQLGIALMVFVFYLILSFICSPLILKRIQKTNLLCITGIALYFTVVQFCSVFQ